MIKNKTKEKILLLLLGGLAFGCSYTIENQRRVLRAVSREWRKLDQKKFRKSINDLCRYEFVGKVKKQDGSFGFFLTEKGRMRALNCRLENIKNKKTKWDGKWRMVAFDVPEKYKRGRDALRQKLKNIGFCEMQKSVFITPYDCVKEIGLLVKFFELDKYVRFGVLELIDNDRYFREVFKII